MALPKQKFRELVFHFLYSMDRGNSDHARLIDFVVRELRVSKKEGTEAFDRAEMIAAKQELLDSEIAKTSTEYAFSRIQSVEQIALRLALFEMLFDEDVPPKVAIAEGLRLAKKFGSPESVSFVNAILDALYQEKKP